MTDHIKGNTFSRFRTEDLTDDAVRILKKARKLNPEGEFVFMPYGCVMNTDRFNKWLKITERRRRDLN